MPTELDYSMLTQEETDAIHADYSADGAKASDNDQSGMALIPKFT